ncbi:hypothetical protein CEK28_08785 [Xenophilus sp. AP218F]|nr:hypothetical protein CEK28_08785 [Xenophilus sp. AP218F]
MELLAELDHKFLMQLRRLLRKPCRHKIKCSSSASYHGPSSYLRPALVLVINVQSLADGLFVSSLALLIA